MTYTQGGLIEARDYNSKVQYINTIWGVGSGSTGYGQPNLLTTVSFSALITATNWSTLLSRLDLITQHQTGTATGITRPSTGDLISFVNTLNMKISSIVTNKLVADDRGDDLPTALGNPAIANSQSWTANAIKEFKISFDNADKMRYFFNCGGLITFYMTLNGSTFQKCLNISTFLVNQMGRITFGSNYSTRSGVGGYATIDDTTLGFWRLESFYQTIFSGVSTLDTYYMTSGFYSIVEAKKSSEPNSIVFRISLFDPSPDPPGTGIDGTLSLFVGYTPPETVNLTDVWGTPTLTIVTNTQGPAPIPLPTYSIAPDLTTINEGQTVTYSITTTNFGNGTLYWKDIGGRQAQYFDDEALDGTVNITSDRGTVTRTPTENQHTDGDTYIRLRLYDTNNGNFANATLLAASVDVRVVDTSTTPVPGYSINPDRLVVDEGDTVSFTVTTSNLPNSTLYWSMAGTATAADFDDSADSGTVDIINNSGLISRQILADHLTEGPETFLLQLRTTSVTGPIVATSPTITINDTSAFVPGPPAPPPTISYVINPDKRVVNEGETVTYTVTTTGFGANGNGILYWTNNGTTSEADFTDGKNKGAITITNNSGILVRVLKEDLLTEGAENIIIQLRRNSETGTLVAVAPIVNVNDTSLTVIPDPVLVSATITPVSAQTPGSFTINWVAQNANQITVSGGGGTYTNLEGSMNFTDSNVGVWYRTVVARNTVTNKTDSKDVTYEVLASPPPYVAPPPLPPPPPGSPTYSLVANPTTVNEGGNFTITFTTANSGSGPWPYTITGVSSADLVGASLNGNWTSSGQTLTYFVTVDSLTEGTELFTMTLNGNLAQASVQINDTSTTPAPPPPPTYPPAGQFLRTLCKGTTLFNVLTDGTGGEYEDWVEDNSLQCGYVAPPPPPVAPTAGTPAGAPYCVGYNKIQAYNDGNFGTYAVTLAANSPDCGYVAPPPYVPPPAPVPTPAPPPFSGNILFSIAKTVVYDYYNNPYDCMTVTIGSNPYSFNAANSGSANSNGNPTSQTGNWSVSITNIGDAYVQDPANFTDPGTSKVASSNSSNINEANGEDSTAFIFGSGSGSATHSSFNPNIRVTYAGATSYYSGGTRVTVSYTSTTKGNINIGRR